MTKAKPKAGLLDKLEKSLTDLIADMDKKGNTDSYSLTDRMKVYDRVLKLEALKQGIGNGDEGAGFEDD
jgi:hypothetical protein